MPHQIHLRTLGRPSDHRLSMLRNLAVSVLRYERVRTTEAKAKEVRRLVDKVVKLGREGSLVARRRAVALTRDRLIVEKVFTDLRERFGERPGGFTRLIRLGHRVGDGAPMMLVELLEGAPAQAKPEVPAETAPESGVRGIARRLRGRRAEQRPEAKEPERKAEKKAAEKTEDKTEKEKAPRARRPAAKRQAGGASGERQRTAEPKSQRGAKPSARSKKAKDKNKEKD